MELTLGYSPWDDDPVTGDTMHNGECENCGEFSWHLARRLVVADVTLQLCPACRNEQCTNEDGRCVLSAGHAGLCHSPASLPSRCTETG